LRTSVNGLVEHSVRDRMGICRGRSHSGQALHAPSLGTRRPLGRTTVRLPTRIAVKFQELVQDPKRRLCDLHTCEYYDLVWTCKHDCIVRDSGLWKRPMVREYYGEVVMKSNWWYHGGAQRRAYSSDTSFMTIVPKSLYKELVVLTPAPGRSERGPESYTTEVPYVSGNNKRSSDRLTFRTSPMTNLRVKPEVRALVRRTHANVPRAVGLRKDRCIMTAERHSRMRREKRPS
jgi:hypothetical protein